MKKKKERKKYKSKMKESKKGVGENWERSKFLGREKGKKAKKGRG